MDRLIDVAHPRITKAQLEHMDSDQLNRGSYMRAHVLSNLLNKLRKRDRMRGLPNILSLFRKEFNKFNNTGHEC